MRLNSLLHGSVATLRQLEIVDAEGCTAWLRTPAIAHYLSGSFDDLTVEGEREWIAGMIESPSNLVAGICVRESNGTLRHVGNTGLHGIDRANGRAVIGIFIGDASIHGRGIGRDAIRTLTTYAFTELGLRRVEARVFAPNVASRTMCQRAGLIHEGILRANYIHPTEGPLDEYVFSALASEWTT